MKRIAVIGDGGWGTALAMLLCGKGEKVTLWSNFPDYAEELRASRENRKFLPGVKIPSEIEITSDLTGVVKDAELLVSAVPVIYLRAVMTRLAHSLTRLPIPIVSVAKGIENGTLMRGSEIIADCLGARRIAVLSGPSHAEEVSRGLPATVVASARDMALAREIQQTFMTQRFRVYTNPDMVGVELGAAVKNVIAIAAGILDGLGLGDNAKSALITRGLAEITRLGVAMGADARTFAGLAGLGDLITTCISPHGRNRAVGMAIGKGKRLKEVLAGMEMVAEGVMTTKSVCALAARHGVEMPITAEVHKVLFEDKDPRQALADLMMRQAKAEIEGQ
jgi:glycerol-3-phosphate dehydrogenase (NAD(P)+)